MADEKAAAPTSTPPADDPKASADEMVVDEKSAATKEDPSAGDDATTEHKESGVNGTDEAEPAATGTDDDVEMGDANDATQLSSGDANGASTAGDKKSEKPRRKSTGVPEHKTKKSNKKKTKSEYHVDAKPGELYLARMKGHPAWPSIIADDDMLPEAISKSRPVTAPNSDGTWRRQDYAPDGKRHNERTFAIMFLFTNEFAWIPNSDLSTLTVEECKEVSEKNKSKTLLEAYREAAKGYDIGHYKSILDDHANALAEEEAARAEREAEKARKAEKKAKRKSEATAADDEMDVDDEAEESKPKLKKRKKEASINDDEEQPAKTPKMTKLKLSMSKTPASTEKSAKKKDVTAKSGKKKSTAKVNGSDDDDANTPGEEEKPLTAQEKHDKLQEEIRYCRHKLQRSLLSRDSVPSDEEVKNCEPWLKRLEGYPDLAADIITNTKIHKVLKGIIKLPSIPKDEELNFKKRSHELLLKWTNILNNNPQSSEKGDDKKDLNGEAKAEGKEDDKTEEPEKKSDEDEKSDKNEGKDTDAEKETQNADVETPAKAEDSSEAKQPTESEPSKPDAETSKPAETVEAAA